MKKTHTLPRLNLSWGSDPELFLKDLTQNKIVSAIPILKQDKHNPIMLGDDIKFYFDGTGVELAFPPADSPAQVVERFRDVFTRAQQRLGSKYRLLPQAAHVFDDDQLTEPEAREVGCKPSYNCYSRTVNPPADFSGGLRSTSMHIHVGRNDFRDAKDERLMSMDSKEEAIKLMDIYVGCASAIFDKDPNALERKKLYGECGQFRPCVYGVEMRVLDSFPLNSPALTRLAFDLAAHALTHIDEGTGQDVLKICGAEEVQQAVNTHNAPLAKQILKKAKLPAPLMKRVEQTYAISTINDSWGIAA